MPRAKTRLRNCQWCDSEYELGIDSGQHKYCSVGCRVKWHQNKYKTSERSKRDPRKQRSYLLKMKYGITHDDFDRMLEEQGGHCAICPSTQEDGMLHVDHCHGTGRVRGLLCQKCNQALGMLKEDISIMEGMIAYVQRYQS